MGSLRVIEVLLDVSHSLLERPVNTVLNPTGQTFTAGTVTVKPARMNGIYNGAILIAGYGLASEEAVSVISTTASTFTATFANTHLVNDPLVGTTFPSGQMDHPLFTQSEMLAYLADVQADFLLKVRPIYAVGSVAMQANIGVYSNPVDAIRIERIAFAGNEVMNVAKTDIDWLSPASESSASEPRYWYQDGLSQSYAVQPTPQRSDTLELFYSQKSGLAVQFLDSLFVPDCMAFILKWGVLSRALSKDGENRDINRAKFAQQWFDLWVLVCSKFLDGVQGRVKRDEETVEPMLGKMGI